jgi:C-terminal processing protease CtpA/Prc
MNVNLCWIENSFLDKDIKQTLHEISSITVEQPSFYVYPADSLPNMFRNEKKYEIKELDSYKYRLLALFRYWNAVYYFSPYKYLMDKSWDIQLSEFIPKFSSPDMQIYRKAITKMAVTVNDGHAYTNTMPYIDFSPFPPLVEQVTVIDGNTVIRIPPSASVESLLKRGDIILKIGEQDIHDFRDTVSAHIASSNLHYTKYMCNLYICQQILNGTELTVLRNRKEVKIRTKPNTGNNWEEQMPPYKKISDKAGYPIVSKLNAGELFGMFSAFKDTKGIILDLRNYPGNNVSGYIISHLSRKEKHKYLTFTCPDISRPGAFFWIKDSIKYPQRTMHQYNGKIVVLVSEGTMSAAETTSVMYRTAINATLIGRPTAGANGNVSRLSLPGEITVCFSGLGAYYPDSSETQRKGIIPDIEVYPDMQSILDGKDEILERAISYVNEL